MLPAIQKILQQMRFEYATESERIWVEQLQLEYSTICYQFGAKLRAVTLVISDSLSTWGSWNSTTRCISISRELILKKSWDRVVGILKHEMAHQYAEEILKAERAHGNAFALACEALGVPREFRRASIPLSDPLHTWNKNPPPTTEDAILRKVEKLLSLAQSNNESEAYLAMEKVQSLFSKYNLERTREKMASDYVRLVIDTGKKRVEKPIAMIASILGEHYFTRIIFSSTFDAQTCQSTKTIEVMGTRENVVMAEYVYHFLHNSAESLWNRFKRENGATSAMRMSYQVGLLTGFREKLERMSETRSSITETKSLMKTFNQELDNFVDTIYPKLASRSHGKGVLESDSFRAGKRDGENIVIHKGVSDQKSGRQALLR